MPQQGNSMFQNPLDTGYDAERADEEKIARLRRKLKDEASATGRSAEAGFANRGMARSGEAAALPEELNRNVYTQTAEGIRDIYLGRQELDETNAEAARERALQAYMQGEGFAHERVLQGEEFEGEGGLERLRQTGRMESLSANLAFDREALQADMQKFAQTGEWDKYENAQRRLQELEVQERSQTYGASESALGREHETGMQMTRLQADITQSRERLGFDYAELQSDLDMFASNQDWQSYENTRAQMADIVAQDKELEQESLMESSRQQYGAGMSQLGYQQDVSLGGLDALYGLGSQGLGIQGDLQIQREGAMLDAPMRDLENRWGLSFQMLNQDQQNLLAGWDAQITAAAAQQGFNFEAYLGRQPFTTANEFREGTSPWDIIPSAVGVGAGMFLPNLGGGSAMNPGDNSPG